MGLWISHLLEALEVQFLPVHLASQHFPAGNQMELSIFAVTTLAYDFTASVLPFLLATLEYLHVRQHLANPSHREEREHSVVESMFSSARTIKRHHWSGTHRFSLWTRQPCDSSWSLNPLNSKPYSVIIDVLSPLELSNIHVDKPLTVSPLGPGSPITPLWPWSP